MICERVCTSTLVYNEYLVRGIGGYKNKAATMRTTPERMWGHVAIESPP